MDRDIAASMPAHKTFQASRDDVLTNLAFFLGDPVSPEKLKARGRYACLSTEPTASSHRRLVSLLTLLFTGLFRGACSDLSLSGRLLRPKHVSAPASNPCTAPARQRANTPPSGNRVRSKIRETLNSLILKTPDSWQTSVGLPFVQITGTVVEWDVRGAAAPALSPPVPTRRRPPLAPAAHGRPSAVRRRCGSTSGCCSACRYAAWSVRSARCKPRAAPSDAVCFCLAVRGRLPHADLAAPVSTKAGLFRLAA